MKFVKLDENAILPCRATKLSAGYDFKALQGGSILPGCRLLIPTGIGITEGQPYEYLQLLGKSGLAYKKGIIVMAGVIDADYPGDIGVLLYNQGNEAFDFVTGQSIAQGVIVDITTAHDEEVPEEDRVGGYGSTGK